LSFTTGGVPWKQVKEPVVKASGRKPPKKKFAEIALANQKEQLEGLSESV